MLKDYYAILGIPRDASAIDIKRAYRQKAMIHHPDRDGSHTAMLEINEAFEVLSKPESRQQHDHAFFHQENREARHQAERMAAAARRRAADYPKTWALFETWLNSVTADFDRAQYSQSEARLGLRFPKAGKSVTGWVFISCGALVGFIAGISILVAVLGEPSGSMKPIFTWLALASLAGGACVGRWLHEKARGGLSKRSGRQ